MNASSHLERTRLRRRAMKNLLRQSTARLIALWCFLLIGGCSNYLTCLTPPGGEFSLELSYLEDVGSSHTYTLTRVYSTGLVEIEPGGQRRRCSRIPSEAVSSLKTHIRSESFQELLDHIKEQVEKSPDLLQNDLLLVRGAGFRAHFPPELLTGVVREVVLEVDSVLREEFPTLADRYLFTIE